MDISQFATINNTQRHLAKTSQAYRLIPTARVLGVLAGQGWYPAQVEEARVLNPDNHGFQRHMVRLRHVGHPAETGCYPEIVLVNAHNGNAAFRLLCGLYELVCSNGLVVGRAVEARVIRHVGYTDLAVNDAVAWIVGQFPQVLTARERWKSYPLDLPTRLEFARRALALRFPNGDSITPAQALVPRWPAQAEPHLWNVYNVVEENVIKGGLPFRQASGRWARTRALQAIAESVRLNRELWNLAEEFGS